MLISTLSYIAYFKFQKKYFLIISLIFFSFAIFTRETSLVIPIILFIGTYLYTNKISFIPFLYALIASCYLIIRLMLYPMTYSASSSFFNHTILQLIKRHDEFLCFLYDTFGLSWLPFGHPYLRFSILLIIFSILLFLFIKNKSKKTVIFFATSYLLLLWPSLGVYYSPRYYYESSPLSLLCLITLIDQYNGTFNKVTKRLTTVLFSSLIIMFAFFAYTNLKIREKKLDTLQNGLLALKPDLKNIDTNRPLYFLTFINDGLGTCLEEAVWLFVANYTTPVYYDRSFVLEQKDSNILENVGWRMRCSSYYEKDYVTVSIQQSGVIRFISSDASKIHFNVDEKENNLSSLGKKVINKTAIYKGKNVTTDATLFVNQKYMSLSPVFIVWSYEEKRFKILKH